MKLTLKETITKEVELILPCWRKSKSAYYFITDEFHVQVTNIDRWVSIETWMTNPPLTALGDDSKAITYEEFKRVYLEAIDKLNLKIEVEVRYEFQIVEGSIYIDEIVNEKAGRQFRLKIVSESLTEANLVGIVSDWYGEMTGDMNENHIMIEEYAMFHRDKWEEVQP